MDKANLVPGLNYHTTWQSSKSMRFVLVSVSDDGEDCVLATRTTNRRFPNKTSNLIYIDNDYNRDKKEKILSGKMVFNIHSLGFTYPNKNNKSGKNTVALHKRPIDELSEALGTPVSLTKIHKKSIILHNGYSIWWTIYKKKKGWQKKYPNHKPSFKIWLAGQRDSKPVAKFETVEEVVKYVNTPKET